MLDKQQINDNLKFYKWSKIEACIETETPKEYDIDDFFEEIRKDPPYKDKPVFVINNTVNGKRQNDFLCPSECFFDIDFHFDDDVKKMEGQKKFCIDTNVKSLQGFVDKLKDDPYIQSAGLSKSGTGVRGFMNIQTTYYDDSLNYELDYPTDWNKQIHESNWRFMMNYLKDMYGLDLESKYCDDTSAKGIQQVTYRYRKTGSFYNTEWIPLENTECVINTKNRYTINNGTEVFKVPFLDELLIQNEDKFKLFCEHYDGFKGLNYVLRNQSREINDWWFQTIDNFYLQTGGFRKQGHLDSPDKFYSHFQKQKSGTDLPMRVFLFSKKIYYNDPLILEDDYSTDIPDIIIDDFKIEKLRKQLLPIISDEVYEKLPDLLRELTINYDGSKRDVLLGSLLSTISVFFNGVKTKYWEGNDMYPNLYFFTVAGTGGGKTIIKKAKILTKKLEKEQRDMFSQLKKSYDSAPDTEKKKMIKPVEVKYVIGGDAGKSGVIKYLKNNDEILLVFETEAEVMSGNNKTDWGNWSDIIRNGFGNEVIDKNRTTEDSVHIESPRLSINTSGTFDQIIKVVGEAGTENGAFNRFMFYWWWNERPSIENPHSNTDNTLSEAYGSDLYSFWEQKLKNKLYYFDFTEHQKDKFYDALVKTQSNVIAYYGNIGHGIVLRHFMMMKKICMSLTMLRIFERYTNDGICCEAFNIPSTLHPTDTDFYNSIEMVKVYMKHSLTIISELRGDKEILEPKKNWISELYDLLPNIFNKKTINEINKVNFKKSQRQLDRVIKNFQQSGELNFNNEDKTYEKRS